ncbi:MAG: ADP/ATP-dependent (S)-NAD(P)H-hydrate dehydratase [Actinomycetes bacterium]|jgi:ADP-dependent NAD(P)H-hydrate dehydratase / NAD(P)H-hydrate epimerase
MPNNFDPYLPELPIDAHKYSRGVVGVIAGSENFPGAAVLSVGGARRGGAGYVKYFSQYPFPTQLVLQAYPDVVPISDLDSDKCDAWVIGSGAPEILRLPKSPIVVLDGSALSMTNIVHEGITIITPHEGEAEKLGYLVKDRKATAQKMASELNAIVVLKGPGTIVATPSGFLEVDRNGGKELASAGTGDILAGLMASMMAAWRPTNFEDAAKVALKAIKAHGLAGKLAAEKSGPVVATDVLSALPKILR